MNYSDLKDFPYFHVAEEDGNEMFLPISKTLPNGMEQYHIVLKRKGVEYPVLGITKTTGTDEIAIHTTTGMFLLDLDEHFRINVYNTNLFVSA